MARRLNGLVLAGGESTRMQTDKALLDYHGVPQLKWTYDLIDTYCEETFVSVRADQHDEVRDALPRIEDTTDGLGPAGGLLAAADAAPDCGWLVLACDLPFATPAILENLIKLRNEDCMATAYRSVQNRMPEPLCAIWEPSGLALLREMVEKKLYCPRKTLMRGDTHLLEPISAAGLDNINTPAEQDDARGVIGQR